MTPDPAGMAAADPANPQSWNRYVYVMNNPLNATDPLGLYCYFGDGATIGVSGPRNPGLECGTGALDSSNSGGCMTDASCSGVPVGPSHDDPAGTADSFLNQSIAQNTAQAEASYASWAYAMEKTGGEYVGANGVRIAIGWTMYGGVNGVNESNGEMVDAAGLAELIGSPGAAFMGGGGMGFSGTYFGANPAQKTPWFQTRVTLYKVQGCFTVHPPAGFDAGATSFCAATKDCRGKSGAGPERVNARLDGAVGNPRYIFRSETDFHGHKIPIVGENFYVSSGNVTCQ